MALEWIYVKLLLIGTNLLKYFWWNTSIELVISTNEKLWDKIELIKKFSSMKTILHKSAICDIVYSFLKYFWWHWFRCIVSLFALRGADTSRPCTYRLSEASVSPKWSRPGVQIFFFFLYKKKNVYLLIKTRCCWSCRKLIFLSSHSPKWKRKPSKMLLSKDTSVSCYQK